MLAKRSKCSFGVIEIEYLGHIISSKGVSTDPSKIKAITQWPQPITLKQLRDFLGITGYYRRFVKNYGSIAKPLTKLLKKNSFVWNDSATVAFNTLKVALTTTPILALLDFSKEFTAKTDASRVGIGVVLT